jgi:hypothetical protein
MVQKERRTILRVFSFFSFFSLLPKTEVIEVPSLTTPTSTKTRFIQIATCTYPHKMSFKEFTDISRAWTKPDIIPTIDSQFMKSGKIIAIHEKPGTNYARWVYEFKNRVAFEEWSREVGRQKMFYPEKVLNGFDYKFTYNDLDASSGEQKVYISPFPLFKGNLEENFVASTASHFRREFLSKIFKIS